MLKRKRLDILNERNGIGKEMLGNRGMFTGTQTVAEAESFYTGVSRDTALL